MGAVYVLTGIAIVGILLTGFFAVTHAEREAFSRMEPATAEIERKRLAKRTNERLKLLSTLLNSFGVSAFITGLLGPYLKGDLSSAPTQIVVGLVIMTMLHASAQFVLHFWKSE